jgi:hypothetical protein
MRPSVSQSRPMTASTLSDEALACRKFCAKFLALESAEQQGKRNQAARQRSSSENPDPYTRSEWCAGRRPLPRCVAKQWRWTLTRSFDRFCNSWIIEVAERKEFLVAGGGFVPQSRIDSVQLADSTIAWNAKKRHKGKFFIQFSFSFWFRRSKRILAWTRFCAVRLEMYRRERMAHTRL